MTTSTATQGWLLVSAKRRPDSMGLVTERQPHPCGISRKNVYCLEGRSCYKSASSQIKPTHQATPLSKTEPLDAKSRLKICAPPGRLHNPPHSHAFFPARSAQNGHGPRRDRIPPSIRHRRGRAAQDEVRVDNKRIETGPEVEGKRGRE